MIALRTAFIDSFIKEQFDKGTRQIVLLGAGFDVRAYRMCLDGAQFFEVDQPELFDAKEPLFAQVPLQCARRVALPIDLGSKHLNLVEGLQRHGFNLTQPSCWVLEGLIMYLKPGQVQQLAKQVSALSARRSTLVHDAVSATANKMGIHFCGAKFRSGDDDYARLWNMAGFATARVMNWGALSADRQMGQVSVDMNVADASPRQLRGNEAVVLVTAYKPPEARAREPQGRSRIQAGQLQHRQKHLNRFAALARSDGASSGDKDEDAHE
ncbi:unnamed protein product [Prorocentrum cordatum]|uniref:S-adenosyl-L-methionine-dependent methyltransferase n=1 Tax=Prorocentrum cordatum TaxID=2364126 RepID=A0ABN9T091_9DINO|nr:unnamed protein product [Polarella glacialis]